MEKSKTVVSPTMQYSRSDLDKAKQQMSTSKEGNKHYEFFGSFVSVTSMARYVILFLSVIIILLLLVLYASMNKPALVFKADTDGKVTQYSPINPDSVFDEELIFATRNFIESHNDLNPATVENSLNDALSVTTKQVREILIKEIKENDYIGTAQKFRPSYTIDIGTIEIKSREFPYYKTYCVANVNFLKPRQFVRVHIYEITWRKYSRTNSYPSGLYIAQINHYDQGNVQTNLNK